MLILFSSASLVRASIDLNMFNNRRLLTLIPFDFDFNNLFAFPNLLSLSISSNISSSMFFSFTFVLGENRIAVFFLRKELLNLNKLNAWHEETVKVRRIDNVVAYLILFRMRACKK